MVVSDEGGGHLEALGRDVTDGGLDIVGDPLDKVAGVLVDDVDHLLVNLLGAHAATEHDGAGQVACRDEDRRRTSCSWHRSTAG